MRERSSVSERTTSRGNGIAPVASDAPTLAFFGRSLTNRVKAEARSIGETQYCAQLPRGLTSACSWRRFSSKERQVVSERLSRRS